MANRTFVDRTGQSFGDLIVIERAGSDGTSVLWRCRCTCGAEVTVPARRLVSSNTKSCGCRKSRVAAQTNLQHGLHGTPIYKVWENMKQRCLNPKNPRYADYGGRGITICDRWMSFDAFFADVGEPPFPGAQLDRVDNDGPYAPTNFRWATRSQNQRNRRAYPGAEARAIRHLKSLGYVVVPPSGDIPVGEVADSGATC